MKKEIEFIPHNKRMDTKYYTQVYLDGVKLAPSTDYIYEAFWKAEEIATRHKIELLCNHSIGSKVTIIQYEGHGHLPHTDQPGAKELWRNTLCVQTTGWEYNWWTNDVMAELSNSEIDSRGNNGNK